MTPATRRCLIVALASLPQHRLSSLDCCSTSDGHLRSLPFVLSSCSPCLRPARSLFHGPFLHIPPLFLLIPRPAFMTSTHRRSLSNHAPPRPLSTISITSTSSSSSAPPGLPKSPSMSPTLPPSPIASASSYAQSDESADSPHPLRVFDPFLNGNGPQSPALSTSTTAATFIANAANSLLKVARRAHACEPCRKSKVCRSSGVGM